MAPAASELVGLLRQHSRREAAPCWPSEDDEGVEASCDESTDVADVCQWRRPSCRGAFVAGSAAAALAVIGTAAWAARRSSGAVGSTSLRAAGALNPPDLLGEYAALVEGGGGLCWEAGGHDYALQWKAEGRSFWDEWEYLTDDLNNGAAEYVTRTLAKVNNLTVAHDTHAILRAGSRGTVLKRQSVKVTTRKSWRYFLMAMKYEAVPWGCGLWPALWTLAPDTKWPTGGELDILEYANEIQSRTSLHVGVQDRCSLDQALLKRPGCSPLVDACYNFTGHYDCVTDYPEHIGCAPNDLKFMMNGEEMSKNPSVIAAEWTPEYIKVFRIPNSEIPQDLADDKPRPDEWDKWLMSYYPFARSEQGKPGSCPNPAEVMKAQQIVLNLGFCGDWAAKVWDGSSCANRGRGATGPFDEKGPRMPEDCIVVDPQNPGDEIPAGPRDCCTQFIYDEDGTFGTDEYLKEHGFFNISWVKVFQSSKLGLQR